MTNTYAVNTTRGKEFEVETDLRAMGVNVWVPRQLCIKHVKEKKDAVWYDRPYVGKLIFCVFPAVYFRDVCDHKHVIGKPLALSQKDIDGTPSYVFQPVPGDGLRQKIPARPGLKDFKRAVEAEYADMQRKRENSNWVCAHQPGDALRIIGGSFEGFPAIFKESVRNAKENLPEVRVDVEIFGRTTPVQLAPDMVERA